MHLPPPENRRYQKASNIQSPNGCLKQHPSTNSIEKRLRKITYPQLTGESADEHPHILKLVHGQQAIKQENDPSLTGQVSPCTNTQG